MPPNKVTFMPKSITLTPEAPFLNTDTIKTTINPNITKNINSNDIYDIFTPPLLIHNSLHLWRILRIFRIKLVVFMWCLMLFLNILYPLLSTNEAVKSCYYL